MSCNLRLTCAVAALAVSALVPCLASAEALQFRSSGPSASAGFTSSTGCLLSQVGFTVSEGRSSKEFGAVSFAHLILFIFEYDTCTTEEYPLLISENFFFGAIPPDAFATHGRLHSASLQVTVDAYNGFIGAFEQVTLDLTWTGEGEVTHEHSHEHQTYPGLRQISHRIGSFRGATASGSVLVNGRELLVPPTLQGANLNLLKYSLTTVYHSR